MTDTQEPQDPQRGDATQPMPRTEDQPPVGDGLEIQNQTPEVAEFGRRAVESGDPDGEDRPVGDPATAGRPLGGGERGPDVDEVRQDRTDADGDRA